MLTFFLISIGAYIVLVSYIYARQRQLIYHPDPAISPLEHYHLGHFSEQNIPTPDGEQLQCWYHPANPGFPTIIYYHGNAYNLGGRARIYNELAARGFGVLALSYRGYGKSTGKPSEQGIYTDARTIIRFATDSLHIPLSRLMLFGESLGTGVAVQMATEFDVAAIILQAPYMSVARRAAELYRYIPVRLLIKDKYHTIDKIAAVKAPLLIFHGELDAVIPVAHGRAVLNAATAAKKAIFFPSNGHNDFDSRVISEHVLAFAQTHHLLH